MWSVRGRRPDNFLNVLCVMSGANQHTLILSLIHVGFVGDDKVNPLDNEQVCN
jgi:hypothetical protein